MPVCNEIFPQLAELYHSHYVASDKDYFLQKNRKQIKVLVDSLWEQTIESIFSVKPRNYTDARRIINQNKDSIVSPDDMDVINSLSDVLKDYDVLIYKNYISLAKKIQPLFLVALRRFCINLTMHRNHIATVPAIKLRTLLNKV